MIETASREILWNVNSLSTVIIMYSIFAFGMLIGLAGIWRQVEMWSAGKPAAEYLGNWAYRFSSMFEWGLMQRGVIREKTAALAHSLIYIGFVTLLFATTMVFIDHDLGIQIYQGRFYLAVTVLSDVLGFAALLGTALIAKTRYMDRPDRLHSTPADVMALIVLAVLLVQGFLLEGLRIHVTNDPWAAYSPIGLAVAKFFWFLSDSAARSLHAFFWWFHAVSVFAVIALLPYTKAFHIIASPLNLFFRDSSREKGELKNPGDLAELIEKGEDFSIGTASIEDYSWKQLLDLSACTSCGRCQAACPAYITNKPLSPKWLILDTRNHALLLNADNKFSKSWLPGILQKIDRFLTLNLFLKSSAVKSEDGKYIFNLKDRSTNKNSNNSLLSLGGNAQDLIAGEVLDPNVFWSCTTCRACVEACPVGINHVEHIIENRRNLALMRGEIPSEAQAALRRIETQGNPFGAREDRSKWLDGDLVKIVKSGDSVDYLYWVGCVSAFDKRKQKIAKSLVKIMKAAGLDFGILGNAECCTGDPARRLGEENLFQSSAKTNIETLKGIKFKYLIANCPHCFNNIKNEYPQFGDIGEGREIKIIHHSQLISKLLSDGKIKVKQESSSYTFHDPCYLGRYNDEYDAPRKALKSGALNIVEMEQSKNKGLCCGAGGGHYFMDLKIGDRVNSLRTDQAAATGADKIATACPFCLQMMEDGVKLTNREDKLSVKDIAEVVADNLIS
jgi:Fe-S oxidoreductase/nitrate reductase gamma subunit